MPSLLKLKFNCHFQLCSRLFILSYIIRYATGMLVVMLVQYHRSKATPTAPDCTVFLLLFVAVFLSLQLLFKRLHLSLFRFLISSFNLVECLLVCDTTECVALVVRHQSVAQPLLRAVILLRHCGTCRLHVGCNYLCAYKLMGA